MHIIPMRDLKNTVKIEQLCATAKEPIFVTKNGYGSLVVMDIDTYERILSSASEAQAINEALADVEAGRVKDGKLVLEALQKKWVND